MTPIDAIPASSLAKLLHDSHLFFGAVATVHLLGVGLLFGSIAVLDLRLLGFSRSISVRKLTTHTLPLTLFSFVLIVPSGLAMFFARAAGLVASRVFALKMGLIMAAGVNAGVYYTGVFQGASDWDIERMPPPGARLAGALSLVIWMAVLACGSMLAATVT